MRGKAFRDIVIYESVGHNSLHAEPSAVIQVMGAYMMLRRPGMGLEG